LLALLFVAFVSTPAYAHRRHHHHHQGQEHFTAVDLRHGGYVREESNVPQESESRESEQELRVPAGASPNRAVTI
jgi:hypothetical protein